MRVLTIDWPGTDAEGWIDYIPIDEFDRAGKSRLLRHLVIGPSRKIIAAECWISVDGDDFEIEYNGDHTTNSPDIASGTLRIEFDVDDHNSNVKALWRDAGTHEFAEGPQPQVVDDPFIEGAARVIERTMYHRDPVIRLMKKESARSQNSRLLCEACEFDFEGFYGDLGRDYCEIHHRKPISESGVVTTQLADLAVVCSNCHSMIHRYGGNLDLTELRQMIAQARAKHSSG